MHQYRPEACQVVGNAKNAASKPQYCPLSCTMGSPQYLANIPFI